MRTADYEEFAAALCNADAPVPEFLQGSPEKSMVDRFAVYRNNIHVSLVDSLAESYPVVLSQVGDDFFRAMARAYVQQHKPVSALLSLYGEDFADFIAGFRPADSLPWLPDVARLERAWSECWAAADMPSLPVTALRSLCAEDLAGSRLRAHPAARLVRSAWPIASLWEAHQSPKPDLSTLQWQPQCVLLTRPHADVTLHCIDGDAARFAAALMRGLSIEAAVTEVPHVDAGAMLAHLLDAGFVLEIHK